MLGTRSDCFSNQASSASLRIKEQNVYMNTNAEHTSNLLNPKQTVCVTVQRNEALGSKEGFLTVLLSKYTMKACTPSAISDVTRNLLGTAHRRMSAV